VWRTIPAGGNFLLFTRQEAVRALFLPFIIALLGPEKCGLIDPRIFELSFNPHVTLFGYTFRTGYRFRWL